MKGEVYNKVKGGKYNFSNNDNLISLYPNNKSFFLIHNKVDKGVLKYKGQKTFALIKIKFENEFWILEIKKNEIEVFKYKNQLGRRFIKLQEHLLNTSTL